MANIIKLHSPKARGTMKAAIAASSNAAAKKKARLAALVGEPITRREHIKGFWAQYPRAKHLFGIVMREWRASNAQRFGHAGYWAAYPYDPHWCEAAEMRLSQLKVWFDRLEAYGLIERELGQHSGRRVLAYIRPTPLALKLSKSRPSDWQHLGLTVTGKTKPATTTVPFSKIIKPAAKPDDDDEPLKPEDL